VPDARPDPALVGRLTARLYAAADHADLPRETVEQFAEYLLATDPLCRHAFDLVVQGIVEAAKAHGTVRQAVEAANNRMLAQMVAGRLSTPLVAATDPDNNWP